MREYSFSTNSAVVEFFGAQTNRNREDLLRVFRQLSANPSIEECWIQKTTSGRELYVKRLGRWLVTFWIDAPIWEVRIVDVRKVLL